MQKKKRKGKKIPSQLGPNGWITADLWNRGTKEKLTTAFVSSLGANVALNSQYGKIKRHGRVYLFSSREPLQLEEKFK